MIDCADEGILFRPPVSLIEERPDLPVAKDHTELQEMITERL